MIFAQWILAIALSITAVLGMVIYFTHRRRAANQQFLVLSLTVSAWLFSVLMVFDSSDKGSAAFWIRIASISGAFLPVAFTALRLSISYPELRFLNLCKRLAPWLTVFSLIAIFSLTPAYLVGAELPTVGVPNAIYGQLAFLFPIYFIGALLTVLRDFLHDLRRVDGVSRLELQYVFIGLLTFFGAGLFAGVIPHITHNSQIVSLSPLWVVVMDSVIAFGIATKRIMDVSVMVRRVVSYGVLLTYLALVYLGVWWIFDSSLRFFSLNAPLISHLAGTLTVAFSISRAHTRLQLLVSRLFINFHDVDLREALRTAESVLTPLTTTDDLLQQFTLMLSKATGTEFAAVYLFTDEGGKRVWSTGETVPIAPTDPLPMFLREKKGPFLGSIVHRAHASESANRAAEQLRTLKSVLALGLYAEDRLVGVILLGAKLSGRLYDNELQETLQLLVSRLAIALENARLYTELQRSKIYVESLLDQLVSGVVAANENGVVTLCNREAEKILRVRANELVGSAIQRLPPSVSESLETTLQSGAAALDQTTTLEFVQGANVPIRFSTQLFGNESFRGAFLVFSDLTHIKKLEEQLRRADRLSCLGTLAASVAHEIRNPLVPIKTFVGLIPERKSDAAFMDRFTKIVSSELQRIDRIVNQLLSFARVNEPQRRSVGLHEVLDETIALIRHDFAKRNVDLQKDYRAAFDKVFADKQQLEQVFLNVLINALEAIPVGGKLTIETAVVLMATTVNANSTPAVQIRFKDNGRGISSEALPRVFEPFFTTNESGTGLGLSIVSGIVNEHGGCVEISNEPDRGVSVRIQLPLKEPQATEVAA